MNQTNGNTPRPLGQTLFLSGICVVLGTIALLVGIRVIPSGKVEPSAFNSALGVAAGLLFIFAGIMVFIRDRSGAKDNEEIPKNAPLALRIGESLLTVVILALFAIAATLISFGPFFSADVLTEMQRQMGGFGTAIFRIFNGVMALVLWYAAIYIVVTKLKRELAKPPIDPGI